MNKDNATIQHSLKFVSYLCKKIGKKNVLSIILQAESELLQENETLFQHFLDELRLSGLLSFDEQQEYLSDYIKHNSILTPADTRKTLGGDQSPISFENKIFRKNDTSTCSFQKTSSSFHNNLSPNFGHSPNFDYLKKPEKIPHEKHMPPDPSLKKNMSRMTDKNPKSSNLTSKSEENLPSFYSGKQLFDPSPKENLLENYTENERHHHYTFYSPSLKAPKFLKSLSENLFPNNDQEMEDPEVFYDERTESKSFR